MGEFQENIEKIIGSPFWTISAYVLVFCLVVIWLALVVWTYKDAQRRIDDLIIVIVAVLASLVLPYMGTLIYTILRPSEYLVDARERELEMRAMEQELQIMRACPSCGEAIKPEYVACPSCRRTLRSSCTTCDRVLEPSWKICPYCGQDARAKRVAPPTGDAADTRKG